MSSSPPPFFTLFLNFFLFSIFLLFSIIFLLFLFISLFFPLLAYFFLFIAPLLLFYFVSLFLESVMLYIAYWGDWHYILWLIDSSCLQDISMLLFPTITAQIYSTALINIKIQGKIIMLDGSGKLQNRVLIQSELAVKS